MSCFGSSAQAVAPSSAPASASASPIAADPPSADAPAAAASAVAVAVVVRIRPMIAREQGSGAKAAASVLSVVSDTSLQVGDDPSGAARADAASRLFTFDRVLGEASTQDDAFRAVGEPILLRVLEGFNGCVFAYGQTASGKTFTMEGASSTNADASAASSAATRRGSALSASSALSAAPAASEGVIPRLCARLCDSLSAREAAPAPAGAPAFSWVLQAQYVEIYNEAVRDLLAAAAPSRKRSGGDEGATIRQRPDGTIFLEGVNSRVVHGAGDIAALLLEGQGRRTRGETAMNALSSRSHAVLSLSLAATTEHGGGDALTRESKLHLVDLAGSERADSTGATGERLKEGARINLSLTALGNVISALTTPGRAHVPYRDSKLTRLLQDSLGGNSYTAMICCVSPAASNYDETLASLRFAQRAKLVTNKARVNADPSATRIAALLEENRALRARCAALEAAATAAAGQAPAPKASGGGCVIA
jgi:hypothetical protein